MCKGSFGFWLLFVVVATVDVAPLAHSNEPVKAGSANPTAKCETPHWVTPTADRKCLALNAGHTSTRCSGHELLRLRGGRKRDRKQQQGIASKRARVGSTAAGVGIQPPPIVVAFVPFTDSADADEALRLVATACLREIGIAHDHPLGFERRPVTLSLPAKCGGGGKRRVTFIALSKLDPMAMLDGLKIADCAVLLHSGSELPAPSSATKYAPGTNVAGQSGSWGGNAIALLRAQGLPEIAVGATDAQDLSAPSRTALRKARARLLASESLGEEQDLRSFDMWDAAQVFAMLRSLTGRNVKGPSWREPYAFSLGVSCAFDQRNGTLTVCGYLSGNPLSANQLVHITGVGTFAVERIMAGQDPCPARSGAWVVHGSSQARGWRERTGHGTGEAGVERRMEGEGAGDEGMVDGEGAGDEGRVEGEGAGVAGMVEAGDEGRMEGVLSQRDERRAEELDSRPEELEGEGEEDGEGAGNGKLGEMGSGEAEEEEEEEEGGAGKVLPAWASKRETYFQDWEEAAQDASGDEEEDGGTREEGAERMDIEGGGEEGGAGGVEEEVEAVKKMLRKKRVAKQIELLQTAGCGGTCRQPSVHSKLAAVLDNREDIGGRDVFGKPPPPSRSQEGGQAGQAADRHEEEEEEEEGGDEEGRVALGQRRMGNKGGKAERRLRAQLRGEEWEFLEGLELLGGDDVGEQQRREYEEALREAEDDLLFPDQVATPTNQTIQRRFAKYAPLHDLSKCSVDPCADLPLEYKRIFQFGDFRSVHRRVLKAARHFHQEARGLRVRAALPGHFVELQLRCESGERAGAVASKLAMGEAVVVSGLLRHENKRGVLNMMLRRQASVAESEVVRSKDQMEFHFGFRRELARPLLSEAVAGSAAGGGQLKFIMRRFLPVDVPTAATILSHTIYPNTPVLAFRPADGRLLATGSVVDMDSDRIILKRVVLTGDPFRMHKRTVVVRWMFFFASDVKLLAGAKLWTKFGRTGEVLEALGTHGLTKCVLSDAITHKDTVCLSLYKRVFPKSLLGSGDGGAQEQTAL